LFRSGRRGSMCVSAFLGRLVGGGCAFPISSGRRNWGNLTFLDHEMKEEYKVWADEVSHMFGGLDILALDVLHTTDGKDYIIEVNDTAPGLMYEHEQEDLKSIRDLVVARLNAHYYPEHK